MVRTISSMMFRFLADYVIRVIQERETREKLKKEKAEVCCPPDV
jgi:hypothetical protein